MRTTINLILMSITLILLGCNSISYQEAEQGLKLLQSSYGRTQAVQYIENGRYAHLDKLSGVYTEEVEKFGKITQDSTHALVIELTKNIMDITDKVMYEKGHHLILYSPHYLTNSKNLENFSYEYTSGLDPKKSIEILENTKRDEFIKKLESSTFIDKPSTSEIKVNTIGESVKHNLKNGKIKVMKNSDGTINVDISGHPRDNIQDLTNWTEQGYWNLVSEGTSKLAASLKFLTDRSNIAPSYRHNFITALKKDPNNNNLDWDSLSDEKITRMLFPATSTITYSGVKDPKSRYLSFKAVKCDGCPETPKMAAPFLHSYFLFGETFGE